MPLQRRRHRRPPEPSAPLQRRHHRRPIDPPAFPPPTRGRSEIAPGELWRRLDEEPVSLPMNRVGWSLFLALVLSLIFFAAVAYAIVRAGTEAIPDAGDFGNVTVEQGP